MPVTYPNSDGPMVMEENQTPTGVFRRGIHPYRLLHLTVEDGKVVNDGADTETVTVELKDGLAVANGQPIEDAPILEMDEDVVLAVNGNETTKSMTDGILQFDLTSTMSAGTLIEAETRNIVGVLNGDDSATIEVVSL